MPHQYERCCNCSEVLTPEDKAKYFDTCTACVLDDTGSMIEDD